MMSNLNKEINAVIATSSREVLRATKSPGTIVSVLAFPIIYMGLLGGSLAQNMAGGLNFNYLQFMMVGMIVNILYQVTIGGVLTLVEDRENNFTQEIFVSPISRYSIIIGKIIGCSIISILQLAGVFGFAFILGIPFTGMDILRMILLAPVICLVSGSLSIFFIGFVQDQKTATIGSALLVIPQMFLSGAFIPINKSNGILGFLAHIMPMTYSVDLARAVFYWNKPEYSHIILFGPVYDIAVTFVFILTFSVIGTILFTRSEKNR